MVGSNCHDFPIFKIFFMPKIFKFCDLKDFNYRKNLEDWEIMKIWPKQKISMINLKPEIVKNLKSPQLDYILWCIYIYAENSGRSDKSSPKIFSFPSKIILSKVRQLHDLKMQKVVPSPFTTIRHSFKSIICNGGLLFFFPNF